MDNQYVEYMNDKYRGYFFDKTPKTVFAAIAMSLALRLCEDDFQRAFTLVKNEGERK